MKNLNYANTHLHHDLLASYKVVWLEKLELQIASITRSLCVPVRFATLTSFLQLAMESTEFPVGRLLNGDSYKTQTRMKNISSAMNWIQKQMVSIRY